MEFDLLYFMEFLYFPKDKREYIPAFIMLVIFMAGAVATMYFVYKKSKEQEKYLDEKYKDVDFRHDQNAEEDDEVNSK